MLPSGVFAVRYAQDRALLRTRPQWVSLALFMLLLALLPHLVTPRLLAIANLMLVTAIVVVGLQITLGYAGQVNLGQSAFMGVGAYAAGVLSTKWSLPFLVTIPLGGVAAALFGFVFGLSAVRIKGFYLALTTIAAQFIFHFAVLNLPVSWLGGSNGISMHPARLGGIEFSTDVSIYYLFLVSCTLMVAGAFGMMRSRTGRAFIAVRDDDVAAGMTGIPVVRTKAMAFLVGAFYAGIGGGLYAYYIRFISVDQFNLFNSVWYLGMIIVGGTGSIVGALLGTFLIRAFQEVVTSIGPLLAELVPWLGGDIVFASMNILLGGLIAFFVIVEPDGLMHRWNILKASYRLWPFRY
ncbi:MAG: branched-chain amino acid ABC transporter permease [Candidatus Lambdaproteobacteria bacterium]|nr:branched-chain amino acid ABC transporter permease [Candidatus Lambdaproteobacteria bacterium]